MTRSLIGGRLPLYCLIVVLFCTLVQCQQAPPRILYLNEIMNRTLYSTSTIDYWKLTMPTNETGYSQAVSISVFPVMAERFTNASTSPVVAVTYSNHSEVSYGSSGAVMSFISPNQSLVLPELFDRYNRSYINIFIAVQFLNLTGDSATYYISSSLVVYPLAPENVIGSGVYSYTSRVNAGQRIYFSYEPTTASQIVLEICASNDTDMNHNPVSGSFLFNTLNDQMVTFNEEYIDYPCGNGVAGTIIVTDPQNSSDSKYLKICPTVVYFSAAQPKHTVFAIDVLRFWQAPVTMGYFDFSLYIYTGNQVSLGWVPAGSGSPPFVNIAPITMDMKSSYPDLILTFTPATLVPTGNGEFTYGVFTDLALSTYQRQLVVQNDLFGSACFLVYNEKNLLYGNSWMTVNSTATATADIKLQNFFNLVPEQEYSPFHLTVVAKSSSFGNLAYEYVTIADYALGSTNDGLSGGAIFGIVVAVLVGVCVIVVIAAGIGYYFIKRKKKSEYEAFY